MSMAAQPLPLRRSRRGSGSLFLFTVAVRRGSGAVPHFENGSAAASFFLKPQRRGSGLYPAAMDISGC
jgi:hypothetical protein